MSRIKNFLCVILLCCLSLKINAQTITIDDQRTPQQLIENILVNSSCAAVTNMSGTGDTYTPNQNSFAYFNAGTSNFPFQEGIILATSTSTNAVGPFISSFGGGNLNWKGDSDLNNTLNINSINATSLEFDFIALTNFVSFNYVFASNEYQYYFPCEYSDGFAFLIKEDGTPDTYRNLAVLPNTNMPVSSLNVHPKIVPGIALNGDRYNGCEAVNGNYFSRFNNDTSPINYAGQTVVMTAQTNVTAGKKYHIKLVIADDKNQYYDSAIFLEAGSFTSSIDFGPDRTASNNSVLCFGDTFVLDPKLSASYSYKWFKNGVEIANTPTLNVTDSGDYKVEVTLSPSACIIKGQIKIEYAPEILVTNTALLQCDDNSDGISIFNLTKVDNIVKNNLASTTTEGYYTTLTDAQSKINKIAAPTNYTNTADNQIVYARLENEFGCYKTAEVTLQIAATSIPDPAPISTCDGDDIQDGLYQFDLNAEVTPQVISGLLNGLTVNYYLTANEALTETNPLSNIFKNTTPNNQTIYGRVVNGPDCYDVVPVALVVNTFDPPNFENESAYLCKNDQITLSVSNEFSSYLWSNGDTSNSTIISVPGDYSLTVKDANGCEKTKNFKVILSEPAVITNAAVKDFSGNDNSVLIEYTGVGNYEFSLDGLTFQSDPLFTGVATGTYNAIARDKNGCGPSNSFLLYVLDYPRFFTPNGDGYNDLWVIEDSNVLPNYTIHIFDRYGKYLKEMNKNSPGWNGIFNGQPLPSDDYWFTLTFIDGRNIKGHFSLKR